ncbi:MAG: DUF4388 domain-containing protein, partial [Holophagales bacterium]|nr:DUF4388 domain-containing protein [Holophagales bacterium]
MSGHTVLVIHRDAQLTSLVATVLHDAGFRVLRASDLADAAATFRYFEPDLVLAELGPLRRTSPDTRAMLQGADARRSIPVLAIAGAGEDQSHLEALGVAEVVSFPFRAEALLARVDEHLGKTGPKEPVPTPAPTPTEASAAGMSGRLERFEIPELLTMFDMGRRSGRIRLESNGRRAYLLLSEGDVIDGGIDGGASGVDAVNELIGWKEGSFEIELAESAPAGVQQPKETVAPPTSASETQDFPVGDRPFLRQLAQDGAPAPAPGRPAPGGPAPGGPAPGGPAASAAAGGRENTDALHEALTVLNAVASYASGFAERLLLQRKLEAVR